MTKYILAMFVAFALGVIFVQLLLPILKRLKAGQNILHYVAEHATKQGTPTMGGIAFVVAIVVVSLIFADISSDIVKMCLAVVVGYCIIGFLDDYIKIKLKQNEGLKPYQKIIAQSIIAIVVAMFVYYQPTLLGRLFVPFGNITVDIGWWIVPLIVVIFLSVTNGVNLTDGLDGLATSTTICYFVGMVGLLCSQLIYLDSIGDTLMYKQVEDLIVISVVSIGALLAFLLYNCFPAKVFMGDSGSLALGALVACVSIFSGNSLAIPILGIMFVVSCVSVIIQVVYFKVSKGKRVLLMAPYHHHLQQKGLSETRISTVYATVTLMMGCIVLIWGLL